VDRAAAFGPILESAEIVDLTVAHERDPSLLMGLEPGTYMVLAGFVEFNLTFVVLSSVSLFWRALTLGLFSIFALAIYKFGLIDAV
jgi:hypothetical protein